MKKTLKVVKTPTGTELRVDGKVVAKLGDISFEASRSAAYNYIWDRPGTMWTILGSVEHSVELV